MGDEVQTVRNIVAIIAVRMDSKRLYGKPLQYIIGKPLVGHIIDRLKSTKPVKSVLLATTKNEENGALIKYAREIGIPCFVDNKDEEDVLGRFLRALKWFNGKNKTKVTDVIRATGDSPLHHLGNIEELIQTHLNNNSDMTFTTKLPLGAFLEIISVKALKKAYYEYGKRYRDPRVTLCMNEHPKDFKIITIEPKKELQRPEIRLTVDTPEDLIVMREIYKKLYKPKRLIKVADAIKFLDNNPQISKINKNVPLGNMARIWQ